MPLLGNEELVTKKPFHFPANCLYLPRFLLSAEYLDHNDNAHNDNR